MKGQWALYKVMKRHINKFRYASNIILAVFVSVLCFAQAVSSAPITDASHSDSFTIAESYLPTDGAYIIKNLASGKYLSVERYESKDEQEEMSYAVLSEASGEDTVFSITMQSDYSFLVNSESVGKHLFISSDDDSPLLSFKETDGITSRFSFMRLDDGSFFISPISTDDCNLVLCEDEEGRLSLSAFLGEANQCWIMEKLPVISIKMNRDTLSLTVGRSSRRTSYNQRYKCIICFNQSGRKNICKWTFNWRCKCTSYSRKIRWRRPHNCCRSTIRRYDIRRS